jgi:hypothetical protein
MDGMTFKSVEAAFQAAKTTNMEERRKFINMTAAEAKKAGRKVELREDWGRIRNEIMIILVAQKFSNNDDLRRKLLDVTGEIVEDNTWGDTYWGRCNNVGLNILGKILMALRSALRIYA